jgi:hypothetical protein
LRELQARILAQDPSLSSAGAAPAQPAAAPKTAGNPAASAPLLATKVLDGTGTDSIP